MDRTAGDWRWLVRAIERRARQEGGEFAVAADALVREITLALQGLDDDAHVVGNAPPPVGRALRRLEAVDRGEV